VRQLISDIYNLIILIIDLQNMGTVVQLKNKINNSYFQLKNSNEQKLTMVEERIEKKLV
jgi:octaprenyl-diphosphate synthase